jgi:hypothetical protein
MRATPVNGDAEHACTAQTAASTVFTVPNRGYSAACEGFANADQNATRKQKQKAQSRQYPQKRAAGGVHKISTAGRVLGKVLRV